MALIAPVPVTAASSDLLRSSGSSMNGTALQIPNSLRLGIGMGSSKKGKEGFKFTVIAKKQRKKHEYPWPKNPDPNVKGGILTHLSLFKPWTNPPKPLRLNFERPLVELEKQIAELQKLSKDYRVNNDIAIAELQRKHDEIEKILFSSLTPIQRVNIARHPNRPTFLDHVFNICDKWFEIHGDRAGYDDPAIVGGLGQIDGKTYMLIGHQKGRNTKENIYRNFGMPTPHGYRKALRLFKYADHFNFPIITFIDTPGAFADLKSEYLGQGEAIAMNLRTMFGLRVPIVSVVLGEGGSGGALAIGVANKLLMLENSVFFVASPEACAAILWKTAKAAPKAARKLRITAAELVQLGIADEVIPEPLGGAHRSPAEMSQMIKKHVLEEMDELNRMPTADMLKQRYHKFRYMGPVKEVKPKPVYTQEEVDRMKNSADVEYGKAVEAIGLRGTLEKLREEFVKAIKPEQREQILHKIEEVNQEIKERLPSAPNYSFLEKRREKLSEMSRAKRNVELREKLEKKFDVVLQDPETLEKFKKLRKYYIQFGERDADKLDADLRKLIVLEKVKIEHQLASILRATGLMTDKSASMKAKHLAVHSYTDTYGETLDDVVDSINARIDRIVKNTPLLLRKIELLNYGVKIDKLRPGSVPKSTIEALKKDVKKSMTRALTTPKIMRISSVPKNEDKDKKPE